MRVQVRDEGHAVAAAGPPPTGQGMAGMQERVRDLGGTFTAGARPGGFQADLPLPPGGARATVQAPAAGPGTVDARLDEADVMVDGRPQ